jgi:hypothetical protein
MILRPGGRQKFLIALAALLVFVLAAEAGTITLKNKTNQRITLTCSGQTVTIAAQGTATVSDSWKNCPALQQEVQKGRVAVIEEKK